MVGPLNLTPSSLEDSSILLPKMNHLEVADRIAILRIQEETTYRVKDYIVASAPYRKRASKPVDSDCRIKMCEWCFQVVDFCKFRRETVSIGMSYLDRYLCTPAGRSALCNRKEYQLAAMTALYVAIKLHEPLEMETSLLADLSRGCYTEMEFVQMEQVMLQAIKWRVNGPTVLAFLAHFLALLPSSVHPHVAETLLEYARFQTEIAVAEQNLVFLKPSELALAALLNAVEGMDVALFPFKARAKFVKYITRYSCGDGGGIAGADADVHGSISELNVHSSKVEKVQTKLSMLLLSAVIYPEYDDMDESLLSEKVAQFQKETSAAERSTISSSSSTTSSTKKKKKSSAAAAAAGTSKQKSPVSVIDEAEAATTKSTSTTKSTTSGKQ